MSSVVLFHVISAPYSRSENVPLDGRINQVLLHIINVKAHWRRCMDDVVETDLFCLDNIVEGSWRSDVLDEYKVNLSLPFRVEG